MLNMRFMLLLAGLLLGSRATFSQTPYQYTLAVNDAKAPATVLFGYWRTGQSYIIDSAKVDSLHTVARFEGKRDLHAGLYFFTTGSKQPLDFVINGEYQMDFTTSIQAPLDSFKVKKSVENEPFFLWLKSVREREARLEMMRNALGLLQKATRERDVLEKQANSIRLTREEGETEARNLPKKYPGLLFPVIIASNAAPEIPAHIRPFNADGSVNQIYMQYFRTHFWDHYVFTDERLLQTPVLAQKVDQWLQIQPGQLDSVKANLDALIQKSSVSLKTRQALLRQIMARFDEPSYGGNETMFVYMFDQYYPSATAVGIDTAVWMRVEFKANAYRPTLPGKIAPDFQLPDQNGQTQSLHGQKARYTLLYFFNPKCSSCYKLTPQVYQQTLPWQSKGIKVLAVSTEANLEDWKKYVSENVPEWTCLIESENPSPLEKIYATHTLPNLMLLDQDKKILVRRLPIQDLPKVLQGLAE